MTDNTIDNLESDSVTLILPISPSVNDTYGLTTSGGVPIKYIKTRGKAFFKEVNEYVKKNGFDIHSNIPLKVEIIINFATNHRNDLDNRLKSLLDSLTLSGVYEDDSQINELHVIRGETKKPGSIIIKISEYKED